ncbi:MAG: ABC transporter substrate-binding protein, partial [Clostridiales Family XIII bacterium]|nr:ABC transporter substrate-binding protein [Clostridiales Family XIII bacterium]
MRLFALRAHMSLPIAALILFCITLRRRLIAGSRTGHLLLLLVAVAMLALATGCVDQHPDDAAVAAAAETSGPGVAVAGDAASGGAVSGGDMRIIATSMATVEIMDKLGVDLIGVPHSNLTKAPERYKDVPEIGMPMSPDIELIRSMAPDVVLSPTSLEPDLRPKYEAAGLDCYFLDLKSVDGMYRSIEELGEMTDRRDEARALVAAYDDFLADYAAGREGETPPRALVLMGLPGSYVVATENSYVGDLVRMAGCGNVYAGETEEFIAANTEDMLGRDP